MVSDHTSPSLKTYTVQQLNRQHTNAVYHCVHATIHRFIYIQCTTQSFLYNYKHPACIIAELSTRETPPLYTAYCRVNCNIIGIGLMMHT